VSVKGDTRMQRFAARKSVEVIDAREKELGIARHISIETHRMSANRWQGICR